MDGGIRSILSLSIASHIIVIIQRQSDKLLLVTFTLAKARRLTSIGAFALGGVIGGVGNERATIVHEIGSVVHELRDVLLDFC